MAEPDRRPFRILTLFALLVVAITMFLIIRHLNFTNQLFPITNNGQPWRIAYYEGGAFYENGAGTPPALCWWMKAPLAKPDNLC